MLHAGAASEHNPAQSIIAPVNNVLRILASPY
jgi:hypothetical protein